MVTLDSCGQTMLRLADQRRSSHALLLTLPQPRNKGWTPEPRHSIAYFVFFAGSLYR
jgi:hypothetical protein